MTGVIGAGRPLCEVSPTGSGVPAGSRSAPLAGAPSVESSAAQEVSMAASDHGDIRKYAGLYLKVFGALMILTAVTVTAASFDLAVPLAVLVALVIATLKGSLVASFFMHLVSERPLIFAALVLTAVLFTALIALPLLTMNDQIGQPWTMAPVVSQTER
jgi:caa(3)-type oxidase subunit IV